MNIETEKLKTLSRENLPQPDAFPAYPASWYWLGTQGEFSVKPKSLRLFGRDLVAYRDAQNKVIVMDSRCSHMGADLSQGRGVGHQPPTRHATGGGLHAADTAEGRRLADGATGIAPQGTWENSGRQRRRRSSRGAAGNPIRIVRISRRAEMAIIRADAHRPFMRGGLPNQD